MAPHTLVAHAHKQSRTLLLFLSKPLLLHSDRHLLTCTKGDVPCVPNHKALCQRIMPLMNKVHTHEARVSHTIAPTISRHPSGGKYTLVSKGMVHTNPLFIFIFIELDHANSFFLCIRSFALVWMYLYGTSIGFLN